MQIVVRQISGLGNQLFQYAAGLFFASRYHAGLRIATDLPHNALSHGRPRPFLLSKFHIEIPMAPLSPQERLLFSARPALHPIARAARNLGKIQIIQESVAQRHTFLPEVPLLPSTRTAYLIGYWQAHRFADANAALLRSQLLLREPAAGRNQELLAHIAATPHPVSLHIRRGDYALPQEGNIVLPPAYYTQAIAHLRRHSPDPTFFVFSDDIPYARSILPPTLPAIFVSHNDDASSHQDLRLMSACRHNIIANSSFSWWGAWLNPNPHKIVYAPKFWRIAPDSFYPDLFPPDWTLATI